MIKSNRRVPGTINSLVGTYKSHSYISLNHTPIHHRLSFQKHPTLQTTVPFKHPLQERQDNYTQIHPYELDLSKRGIADLQSSLDAALQLSLISVLNLSNNHLTNLPTSIFNKLSNVTKLYLSHNCIDKISFPYFRQNHLRIVDISYNCLKSLNLEHLQSIVKVDCRHNELSFLTLPVNLAILDCSNNQLSNIYFLEHCYLIEEADLTSNLLYDLKFNFKPYLKFKEERVGTLKKAYQRLNKLHCTQNKIQFIEGMELLPNLRELSLGDNHLSLTRQTFNQLFLLQRLQSLHFQGNPQQGSELTRTDIISLVLSRMPSLKFLNGQPLSQMQEDCESARKTQYSGINEEPYQLFMDSARKGLLEKPTGNTEWNFTLGDCENEPEDNNHSKIHELSQIQFIQHHSDGHDPQAQQNGKLESKDLEQTYHLGLLERRSKEIPLKITRSSSPLVSHHIFYRSFLTALLPMSYVPAAPVLQGADLTSGRRLDPNDDEFVLISRIFQGRGGVIYVKKVNRWCVMESGRQVFARHGENTLGSLGFLLNDISEPLFRQQCRLNRLLRRNPQDITGLQPNAFSYFHTLVRIPQSPSQTDIHYPCVYLIESSQL